MHLRDIFKGDERRGSRMCAEAMGTGIYLDYSKNHVSHQVGEARLLDLLPDHLAVADDGVERGAQLVAHVGQERALGPGRVLRQVDGAHQVVLDPLALGDVGDRHQAADHGFPAIAEGQTEVDPVILGNGISEA